MAVSAAFSGARAACRSEIKAFYNFEKSFEDSAFRFKEMTCLTACAFELVRSFLYKFPAPRRRDSI
eukprot:2240999-Pleurochrysis_carterae.AAC.1